MLNVDKQLTIQVIKDLIGAIDDTLEDQKELYFSDLLHKANDSFFWEDSTIDIYLESLSGLDLYHKLSALASYHRLSSLTSGYYDDTLINRLVADQEDPGELLEYLAYQQLIKLLTVPQGFNSHIVNLVGDDIAQDIRLNPLVDQDYQELVLLVNLLEQTLMQEY